MFISPINLCFLYLLITYYAVCFKRNYRFICWFETNSIALHLNTMEGNKIINTVTNLFRGADDRDWPLIESILAPVVTLDYSSMNGFGPAELSPAQIVDNWASFLPGFDKTDHRVSAFKVQLNGKMADVFYSTVASHFLGDQVWVVTANYHTKLAKYDDTWLITYHKIDFESQSGNANLPKQAHQVIADRKAVQ